MDKWSIPTNQLTGPRRLGGRVSRRGFAFQDAYACLQLTRLLDSTQEIVAVRPEGAQDVDLLYADGHEEYVQIKHEPDEHYTLVALRPILQGFAFDLLEARRAPSLSFVLIARSSHINAAVARLRDGEPAASDIKEVAKLFVQSIQGSPAPQCLVELSEAERHNLAEQLLKQTKLLFAMGDEVSGRLSFESHAYTELAMHGVAGSELESAFNTLKAALDDKHEFTWVDVEELLKRFIGGTAIELFEGRVEALTDDLLSQPADPVRIQQFYAGAPLDWDIIAAYGDIEREQQDNLIRQLSKPSERLQLFCIVAEPGAGKSTLAWRLAAELHRRHGAFVIRIRDKEDANLWYRMADFCQKMRRPFYVLVDDLFRAPDVVNAIRELRQSLPITILATSRANEYRILRLKGEMERVPLKEPIPEEKERILHRLGKTRTDLTLEQQQRLDAANQFLVLMMEVTAGKELSEIVRETLEWLKTHDESAYRAYEYLCFAYSYSISMPTSLLGRLGAEGRFHNLADRSTAQGLFFYDEDYPGNVRVGHPVIAETASSFYETLRAPTNVLQEIVTAIDTANSFERKFVARLLRALAEAKSLALYSALPKIEAAIIRCQHCATQINELVYWQTFYEKLGEHDQRDRCENAALMIVPAGPADCNWLLSLYLKRGWERDALPMIAEGVRQYPEDNSVRASHLRLVERQGTAEQVEQVLQETRAWLSQPQHSEDTYVRTAYLGLVERQGTAEQVEQVLQETNAWLLEHLEDINVRIALIGLVERKGSSELKNSMLHHIQIWLSEHVAAKEVWRVLISALIRLDRTQEASEIALKAISHHPNSYNLTEQYLRLFRASGDEQIVKQLYESMMAAYPRNLSGPVHFAAWLRDHNYEDEAEARFKELIELPVRKTTRLPRRMAHYGYGLLLLKQERYSEAEAQFREVLRMHRGHQMAHNGLAQALRGLASGAEQEGRTADANQYFTEAEKEFRQAIFWADRQQQPQAVFYTHIGWFYIDQERWSDALHSFESAMGEDPDHFVNYWGVGRALMSFGQFSSAANALRTALEKAPEDFQPPASEEIPELLRQCQAALKHNDHVAKDA